MSLARAAAEHRRHQATCARERHLVHDALAALLRHRADLVALLPDLLRRPDWFRTLTPSGAAPCTDLSCVDTRGGTP